jgi:hypothetical protein
VPKNSPLWGSLHQKTIKFSYWYSQSSPHLFFQGILFTYDASTSLDPTNNMKLLNANYEPKAPISTPYILEGKKWMNNQPRSSTTIPHMSNQSSSAIYNFSSFYKYV